MRVWQTTRGEPVAARVLVTWLASAALAGCYSGSSTDDPQRVPGGGFADGGDEADDGADDGDGTGDDAGAADDTCLDQAPAAAPVRRLTNREYVDTVRDSLGVDISEAAAALPDDIRSAGFSNTATAMIVSYDHVDAYRDLAKAIAGQVDMPQLVAESTSCTDFADACESSVVASLGTRLWRRPLRDAEVASFLPVFDAVQEEGDSFEVAAGLVLEALLQSPQFLYRMEEEGDGEEARPLSGWEVASRLSYLVWGSSPDAALYDAAADDALQTRAEVAAQVSRMLEDPRAREQSLRYVEDWLALAGLPGINRDPLLYPEFSEELALAMRDETLAVADELLWEQRAPLTSLLVADFTWASPALAAFYGIADPQPGVARYELAGVAHRSGILTHAGVLAINGHGNRPSIVERGLFVLRAVMCAGIAAPPADVDTSMSDLEPGQSERYYSDARLANATCNACHASFDPLGYGFEPFDGVGAWQEEDPDGNPLREDGWIVDAQGEELPYATAEEYVALLSESESAAACVGLQKPLQHAVGRPLEPADACALQTLQARLAEGDGTYQDLVLAIATHPTFRHIRAAGPSNDAGEEGGE